MPEEARLESVASGLAPVAPGGWFVVNAGDAAWVNNDQPRRPLHLRVRRVRPARPPRSQRVRQARRGLRHPRRLARPADRQAYHAESVEEDFLVLAGECILIVEDEERHLRTWDFVHCPPGTGAHVRRRRRRPVRDRLLRQPRPRRGDVLARIPVVRPRATLRRQRRPGTAATRNLEGRAPAAMARLALELGYEPLWERLRTVTATTFAVAVGAGVGATSTQHPM